MIYFDHAATTPVSDEVLAAMLPYFSSSFANASGSYALARSARAAIDRARSEVAAAIGAKPAEIFFTSGGSEADNWAHRKVAAQMIEALKELALPVVIPHGLSCDADDTGFLVLRTDEKSYFRQAYEYLAGKGHRNIASLFLMLLNIRLNNTIKY